MKTAFLSIKYHADHRNRERIEAIARALEQLGFNTICIARGDFLRRFATTRQLVLAEVEKYVSD